MKAESLGCPFCKHCDAPESTEPCASCDMYFSNYEPMDTVDTVDTVDTGFHRSCSHCIYRKTPLTQFPCMKCAVTPGLPCYAADYPRVEEEKEGEQLPESMTPCTSCKHAKEAKEGEQLPESVDEPVSYVRPSCEDCRYMMRRVEEEPCLSCYKASNFTIIKEPVDGTDENDDVIEPCNSCVHRDNLRCNPPCSHCRQERGIEYPEYEEEEQGTDCPEYEEAEPGIDCPEYEDKASEYKGVVPKHIADMFYERIMQSLPRPCYCPYCGEVPEVVEETIYPGEKHCYVVCNGANLLPHSISVHGRSREEAVANWNSFALSLANKEK